MFFGMLAIGLAGTIAGCGTNAPDPARPTAEAPPPTDPETIPSGPPAAPVTGARVLTHGPSDGNRIAITVDDGYDAQVVAGYVDFAHRTGIHLTFSPNGSYGHSWAPHAAVLKPLIEHGQVQIINHTYSHRDLRKLSPGQIRDELERNDEWVNKNFATTTRPYYRPPFGFRNATVDGTAADLGYRDTVMWSGSYSDSKLITPDFLMAQARRYLKPGVIMLGHANHPTVLGLFDQITALIKERNLNPVTLNEMFGGTPSTHQ
jgi:peptidoglycan/xylan/chitin deacetylase (PgdA/CDA1 family)